MAAVAEFAGLEARTFAGLPMPLTLRLPVRLTDRELETFSRRVRPYQVERSQAGELEIMSPVASEGSEWEAEVIYQLGQWARAHGGHFYSSSGGFTLPDGSMRSPDAGWISDETWLRLSQEERRGFATVCPEFVVEIVSDADLRARVADKMAMWMANGTRLAWMIDPFARAVSVYKPGEAVEVLERPEVVEAHGVVVGFGLEMTRLWAK